MKNYIYVVLCFLLMASCKPGVPDDLIQPDKMALVLHDIHVFDGYIATVSNRTKATRIAASYYQGIYKKFAIDSALYQRSLAYYTNHPKIMEQIYTRVTDQIKKQRDKMVRADSIMNLKVAKTLKAKFKADSIRKADSVKIEKERKKLIRQLDSLKKLQSSPKHRKKLRADSLRNAARFKKRTDSIKRVEKRKVLKKAKIN